VSAIAVFLGLLGMSARQTTQVGICVGIVYRWVRALSDPRRQMSSEAATDRDLDLAGSYLRHYVTRFPLGIALGTAAFCVGFGRLVFMSTKLTVDVIKGRHPHEAIVRMSERRGDR
jgi:hypothetical protein